MPPAPLPTPPHHPQTGYARTGATGDFGGGAFGEPLATGPAGTGPVGPDYTRGSAAGTTGYDTVGHHHTGVTGTGMTGTGATESFGSDQVVERPVGMGVAEVPVVVTEQERVHTGEWCCCCCCCHLHAACLPACLPVVLHDLVMNLAVCCDVNAHDLTACTTCPAATFKWL